MVVTNVVLGITFHVFLSKNEDQTKKILYPLWLTWMELPIIMFLLNIITALYLHKKEVLIQEDTEESDNLIPHTTQKSQDYGTDTGSYIDEHDIHKEPIDEKIQTIVS